MKESTEDGLIILSLFILGGFALSYSVYGFAWLVKKLVGHSGSDTAFIGLLIMVIIGVIWSNYAEK